MLFITAASVLVALFQVVLGQDLKINTLTSAVQCEPVQFTWQGGAPPYYLSLIPGGQPSAQALEQFPVQNGNSMTWTVNLPAGTRFSSSLRDSTGTQAFSDIQEVMTGPDNNCLNNSNTMSSMSSTVMGTSVSSMMSSAASTNTATVAPASGTSRGTSTTSSMSGSTASNAAHAATSSATATSTGTSNAASTPGSSGAMGFAGLIGLIGAAFLG